MCNKLTKLLTRFDELDYLQHRGITHEILHGLYCPYCLKPSEVKENQYGYIYICPSCKASVGTHKNAPEPMALGMLADNELKLYRREAQRLFDALWNKAMRVREWTKSKSRTTAYKWLSDAMNIPLVYTHIAMFDIEQCKQVIVLCSKYQKKRTVKQINNLSKAS